MTYMNDTMRVELSLPIHIMLAVLVTGANCAEPAPGATEHWQRFNERMKDPKFAKSYEIFKQTKDLLVKACDEALDGIYPDNKKMSLLRRIERVHLEMVQPYLKADNPDPRKIGIIAFYLLQHLLDTEFLVLSDESPFMLALNHMLPALSPWEGSTPEEEQDYERLNKSAQKQVRRVLQHLQAEGYYKGIPLPDYGDSQC